MEKFTLYFLSYSKIAELIQRRWGYLGPRLMPLAVSSATDSGAVFVYNIITSCIGRYPSDEEVEYVMGRLRRWLPRPVIEPEEFRFIDSFPRNTLRIGNIAGSPRLILDSLGEPWCLNEKTGVYVRCVI